MKNEELLTRGVEKVYPTEKMLDETLKSGKKLRIYWGVDPTGKLHLGHAVQLLKLRQFQDQGHEIIILIGDFTAQIGDPTDKSATRTQLSTDQVKQFANNYKELIGKILDTTKPNLHFRHNTEWTNKLTPADLLALASHFTVSQLLERDMFQKRIAEKKEIHLHEFLYPIFQAYDAVAMDVDMQIGGNDQTFNMLAGRTLMKKMHDKEKFVLTTKMLADPNGKKMGKTEGNIVALESTPSEIFGAIMSWPDGMILIGFELLTNVSESEIKKIEKKLKDGVNPRDLKAELAKEITTIFHSAKDAEKAAAEFSNVFSKNELPENIDEFNLSGRFFIPDLLVQTKTADSYSDAKRLIKAGAVSVDGTKITDIAAEISLHSGLIIKVGKRRFAKIK